MVAVEEIKRLARHIWEAESCSIGRSVDQYFRAKRILEQQDRIQSVYTHRLGLPRLNHIDTLHYHLKSEHIH